jgi:DNA topoisomerase-1
MTEIEESLIKIHPKKLKKILQDDEKTALAANLEYVSDTQEGIERRQKGKQFEFYYKNKILKDDEDLVRIKSLVIPPAWENVWICKKENGHLQATGLDAMGRKQYKYHPNWILIRNRTKFYRMVEFGKALPEIRKRLKKDLNQKELTLQKVLAACVSVMEQTGIRVGNSFYEKEYQSYGLTTLKDRHVKVNQNKAYFTFRGKKGVKQTIEIKDKKLAKIIKKCQDIPGKELFQFYDEDGKHYSVDSGLVNEYIKEISNADFTAKDFRTWLGTVQTLLALIEIGCSETATERKKGIVDAIDKVSIQLGNTRTVCKKYYIHPDLLTMYEDKTLDSYLEELSKKSISDDPCFSSVEKTIMKILEA